MDVGVPHVFQNCNKGMGGVDQADQSISMYPTAVRGKKWWWVLFIYLPDLAVANLWRLHLLTNTNKIDQLDFLRYITRHYLRDGNSSVSMGSAASAVPSVQYDGVGHYPQKLSQQLRCAVCHKKATLAMQKVL